MPLDDLAIGSGFAPDPPGWILLGATLAGIEQKMREAIRGHLAVMREFGDPIPQPTTVAELIHV